MASLAANDGLASLARPSGGLAMVAADQRYALRAMFWARTGRMPEPSELVDFKTAIAESLARHASALLFDLEFGREAMRTVSTWYPACGLIASLDRPIVGADGLTVIDTKLDRSIDLQQLAHDGIHAAKLVVYWRGADSRAPAVQDAADFVNDCQGVGLVSVLEVVIKPPAGQSTARDHGQEMLDAAAAMAACRPNLYKTEAPYFGREDPQVTRRVAERLTEILPCPWVVLSTGVRVEQFPTCVEALCQSGASGFLAGRAIWADAVGAGDCRPRLMKTAVPRLEKLTEIVDRHGHRGPDLSQAGPRNYPPKDGV